MSPLRVRKILACARGTVAVPRLRMPDLGDGGYDFSGYPHPFEVVVPGHVVGHHAEEWSQCPGAAAGVGPEAVPDSLGAAFYKATEELTVADQVATFTESGFSRTLQPNSNWTDRPAPSACSAASNCAERSVRFRGAQSPDLELERSFSGVLERAGRRLGGIALPAQVVAVDTHGRAVGVLVRKTWDLRLSQ